MKGQFSVTVAVVMFACVSGAQAVEVETVPIGNPGNAGELSGEGALGGFGPNRICGAVDYDYNIGKFEVTAGQYTEFLNAVAGDDPYGLYTTLMLGTYGCMIERAGSSPGYSYTVGAEWADRPVNFVSWGDAARFANWLHNGQLTGAQDLSTTEDGSYYLNGATSDAALMAVVREPDATWVVPSEDEWYKAAYHHNDGATSNYYDFPTTSNALPNNGNPEGDTGNTVNYADADKTIGSPYWRTPVGFFGLSEGPYDTFDQGGNVWEWTEAVLSDTERSVRGGSFNFAGGFLLAGFRAPLAPSYELDHYGFRVVEVAYQNPVPAISEWGMVTMALLLLTAGTLGCARRGAAVA